jgi:hypothetical protein
MAIGFVSFWQQSQNWRNSQANFNDALFGTGGDIFMSGQSNPQQSIFGSISINNAQEAAILAAQKGVDRVKQANADANATPTKSVANVATQVTHAGTLAGRAKFGTDGPALSGGYQFLSGTALKDAFKIATLTLRSQGEAVDTFSVSANTLTASTSGKDAHPVFTLSLKPQSGMWTFTLVNPIDLPKSRLDKTQTIDLSGLVQSVTSAGATSTLSDGIKITIHSLQGAARGTPTAGDVYQGGLAYTSPSTAAASKTPAKYTPPINPLTGYPYTNKVV